MERDSRGWTRRQQPVFFVAGATGCGKSAAALCLSQALRSSLGYQPVIVVNCDALQFYRGLPIATNKITRREATVSVKGDDRSHEKNRSWTVPHFFMDFLDADGRVVCDPKTDVFAMNRDLPHKEDAPGETLTKQLRADGRNAHCLEVNFPGAYNVGRFEQDCSSFIDEFFAASPGGAVVVVGGSSLYLQSLMVENSAGLGACGPKQLQTFSDEDRSDDEPGSAEAEALPEASSAPSAAALWAELHRVDPVCAAWYHPNDIRRIQRSLDLYRETNVRPSVLRLEMQPSEKLRFGPERTMLIWIDADSTSWLDARLDARVDAMVAQGLLDEVQRFAQIESKTSPGSTTAPSAGTIWSAIGFKELASSFSQNAGEETPTPHNVGKLRLEGLELMKSNTRRYARQQRRWIRNRFMTRYAPLFRACPAAVQNARAQEQPTTTLMDGRSCVVRVCIDKMLEMGGDWNLEATMGALASMFMAGSCTFQSSSSSSSSSSSALESYAAESLSGGYPALRLPAPHVRLLFPPPPTDADGDNDALPEKARLGGIPPPTRRCELCDVVIGNAQALWAAHARSRRHLGALRHQRLVEQQRLLGRELPPRKRQR
jgi:tRNA dimethylallyltransferase